MKMNSYYLEKFNILLLSIKNNIDKDKIPSIDLIYNYLSTFPHHPNDYGKDISNIAIQVLDYLMAIIDNYKDESIKNNKELDFSIRRVHNNLVDSLMLKHRRLIYGSKKDEIVLHFPIKLERLLVSSKIIFNFLFANKISFKINIAHKLQSNLLEIICYRIEDANKLIDLIKTDSYLSSYFTDDLPIYYHKNNIGIYVNTYHKSYQRRMAELLYNYVVEGLELKRDNKYDLIDFQLFITENMNSNKVNYNSSLYYLDYHISLNLFSIIKNQDYLLSLMNNRRITFNYNEYQKYDVTETVSNCTYLDQNRNQITQTNNLALWLKLNYYTCLSHMYLEMKDSTPNKSFSLSKNMQNLISYQIDQIIDRNEDYIVFQNDFTDQLIINLLPYFYAECAYELKECNIDEIKKVIKVIKDSLVQKSNIETSGKEYYSFGIKQIPVSIPILSCKKGLVGIEFINYENSFVNLYLIKNGKMETELSCFLQINKKFLLDVDGNYGTIYRNLLANILLDYDYHNVMKKDIGQYHGREIIINNQPLFDKCYLKDLFISE